MFSDQNFLQRKFSVGWAIAIANQSDLTQPSFREFGPSDVTKPVCSNHDLTRGLEEKLLDKNAFEIRKIMFELTCLVVFGHGEKNFCSDRNALCLLDRKSKPRLPQAL